MAQERSGRGRRLAAMMAADVAGYSQYVIGGPKRADNHFL
jgi:hypothetical protein